MRTSLGKSIVSISVALSAAAMAGSNSFADSPGDAPDNIVSLKMALQLRTSPKEDSVLPDVSDHGFGDCRRVSENELNGMRGGFLINANGMQFLLSLGIEQSTFVNGVLVAKNTINLLPQLNASQMREAIISQMVLPSAADIRSTIPPIPAPTAPVSTPAPASITPSVPVSSVPLPTAVDITPTVTPTPTPLSVAAVSTPVSASASVPSAPLATAADIRPTVTPVPASLSVAPVSAPTPAPASASATPSVAVPSPIPAAPVAMSTAPAPASSTVVAQTQNFQPIQVVQIGSGNTFILPNNANLAGTMAVIQNTLDNQAIRTLTVINATLATRDLLRSMAISSALTRLPPNFGR